jgi:hypothetical protein
MIDYKEPIQAIDVVATVTPDGLGVVLSILSARGTQLVMMDRLVLERLVLQASEELTQKPKQARQPSSEQDSN